MGLNPVAEKMFSRKTVEPDTPVRACVGIIIRDQAGKILLEKRSDCGAWGLPGGEIKPGESALAASIREAREETGLDIRYSRLVGVYSEPFGRIVTYPDNGDVVQLVVIVLEAEIAGGELRLSPESLELKFFAPEKLPGDIVPPALEALEDFIRKRFGVLR